jgi:Ca2+-binding RTX toxin-like protein
LGYHMTVDVGGVLVVGPATLPGFGARVTVLGDVNGDGYADFAASAPTADTSAFGGGLSGAGVTYVFYGGPNGVSGQIGQPDGVTLSVILGDVAQGQTGGVLSPAGDINGDGFDDLLVGSSDHSGTGSQRVAFLIYGGQGGFGPALDLAIPGANITRLTVADGVSPTGSFGAQGVGDLNGDGFADLLISSPVGTTCYVLFGDGASHPATLDMGANFGTQKDTYGAALAGFAAGDLNDDGLDDLVLVGPDGAAIVFGSSTMGGVVRDLANATFNGSNGARLGLDQVLRAEALADINGDGIADLLIEGRATAQSTGTECYVLFGRAGGLEANIDLTRLNGQDGFAMTGTSIGAAFGGIGDINGDGLRDFIVADKARNSANGTVYIVFGQSEGHLPLLDLSTLNGTSGYRLDGLAVNDGAAGGQIADVNGDGFGDVIFGIPGARTTGILYGGAQRLAALDLADGVKDGHLDLAELATLLTFAEQPPVPIGGGGGIGNVPATQLDDDLIGTDGSDIIDLLAGNDSFAALSGDDSVRGNLGNDQIFGDSGNDRLWGDGGNDRLFGGAGNDLIEGGSGDDLLSGGLGNDTYRVDSSSDQVEEPDNAGEDTVESSMDFALSYNLENLILIGEARLAGLGTSRANHMTGNVGATDLRGQGGDDTLLGGAGADTLTGGRGMDWMSAGVDTARDAFVFQAIKDSGKGLLRDVIADFVRFDDVIDLRPMDANRGTGDNQAFRFTGTDPRSHAIWWADAGDDVVLRGDVNGDRVFDFEIRILGLSRLSSGDLLL